MNDIQSALCAVGRWALPPEAVCINPVVLADDDTLDTDRVNFPTLTAAGYFK